jgi:dihydroxyacid dehydratase/phosphogluconate dehydratase
MTLDRACVTAAYMSENKAPAARVNGAGGVSALLGRLDLKARHLPHDLRTATLRTLEALCSLALILAN